MKRRATAPDGRPWTVQLVWWPRPTQTSITTDAALDGVSWEAGSGPFFGLIFDAVALLLYPVVFVARVVFRRPWLIEAFREDQRAEGGAWRVSGWDAARSAVETIAAGIAAGDSSPAPEEARAVRYRPKLRRSGLNL